MGAASVSFGRITSSNASEVVAVTNGASEAAAQNLSEVTTSTATAAPAVKAIFVILSLISKWTAAVDLVGEIRGVVARSLATKLDVDIATLFSGASNTVGTSGVDATLDDLRIAAALLRVNAGNRADSGVFGLHPVQVSDLEADAMARNSPYAAALMSASSPAGLSAAQRLNYRSPLFGFPILISNNIQTANASADRAGVLMVTPSASGAGAFLGGAMIGFSMMGDHDELVNQKVAQSLSGVSAYGLIEAKDEFGVAIVTDA
jgi:hypothetical protein